MFILSDILPPSTAQKENLADTAKQVIINAASQLRDDPQAFATSLADKAVTFGLKLVCAILIYLIGAMLIRWVKIMLRKFFKKRKTEPTLVAFVTSLTTITLTILLVITTVSALGVNTTSITALLAAAGVAIGVALSGTLQNFAGGIMILVFKPFHVGDYIIAQGNEGFVIDVNIISTKIRTYGNTVVTLPNGTLFNGTISNFSHMTYHRVEWKIGIAYGTDANQFRKVALDVIGSDPRVLHHDDVPEIADPSVNLSNLLDSAVEFTVRCWVRVEDYWSVFYDLGERLYTEIPEKGMSFPFPQMDVHIDQVK